MVDVAHLPVAVRAPDEIDQAGVVVVDVLEAPGQAPGGRRVPDVGPGEVRPDQGIGHGAARPKGGIDRARIGAPVVEELAGVPVDPGPGDQVPARGVIEVRGGDRLELGARPGDERDPGDVVGPELALPAGEDEGRADDELLVEAALRDDGRRGRGAGVFPPVDVDELDLEVVDEGRLERGVLVIRHRVFFRRQDDPPAEVGPEVLEIVPAVVVEADLMGGPVVLPISAPEKVW